MKNISIVLLVLFTNQSIYCQVYYEAIGAAAAERSNYNVTVQDLYGNYSKYNVQIENLNPSRSVNLRSDYSDVNKGFGDIVNTVAKIAQRSSNKSEVSKRVRYLEFELRSALNVIRNQKSMIETINMLNDGLEKVYIDEINELRARLGLPSWEEHLNNYSRNKSTNNYSKNKSTSKNSYRLPMLKAGKNFQLKKEPKVFSESYGGYTSGKIRIQFLDQKIYNNYYRKVKINGNIGYINMNSFK